MTNSAIMVIVGDSSDLYAVGAPLLSHCNRVLAIQSIFIIFTIYVQLGYSWAVMNPLGLKTLNIARESDLPAGVKFEKDGSISGGQNAIVALFDKLPKPSPDDQIEGTKKFFRELNRLGITGFVD